MGNFRFPESIKVFVLLTFSGNHWHFLAGLPVLSIKCLPTTTLMGFKNEIIAGDECKEKSTSIVRKLRMKTVCLYHQFSSFVEMAKCYELRENIVALSD